MSFISVSALCACHASVSLIDNEHLLERVHIGFAQESQFEAEMRPGLEAAAYTLGQALTHTHLLGSKVGKKNHVMFLE